MQLVSGKAYLIARRMPICRSGDIVLDLAQDAEIGVVRVAFSNVGMVGERS